MKYVPEDRLIQFNKKARLEGIKFLPFIFFIVLLGIYGFSSSGRKFALSVQMGKMTPILHLVTTIIAPTLFLIVGALLSYFIMIPQIVKGASEDEIRKLKNLLNEKKPDDLNQKQFDDLIDAICLNESKAIRILKKAKYSENSALARVRRLNKMAENKV